MPKKYMPRPQDKKQNQASPLDTAPGRDDRALFLPTSMIALGQNPRKTLGDLTELKTSIAARGMLTPLLVINVFGRYELIGGHRRLQCAKELGLADVPCRIIKTGEPEIVKLLDNIMREALSPEDECLALKRLLPSFDNNQSALARSLSKHPSYVNRALRAAELIESGLCAGAQLSKAALMELADSSDPKAVLAATVDGKRESIRQARAAAEAGKGRPSGDRSAAPAIQYRERKDGTAFTVRINFDAATTAQGARDEIVRRLEEILQRLKTL